MKLYRLSETPFEPVSHDRALRKQVLVGGGVLPGIRRISRIELTPGSRAAEHAHPEGFEVFYCTRGDVLFRVNGEDARLGPGGCLIVEPGEAHSIEETVKSAELVYFFLLEGREIS